MMKIFHNPKCSKSRATLELLRRRGIEPEIVEYLKTPPSAAELDELLRLLGREPRELMRTTDAAYQDSGAHDAGLDRAALIACMVDNPALIERPIVLANGKAAVGRPPEAVLAIL